MGLFKRAFASVGLVALLAVSGTALADENDDVTTTSDVTMSDVAVSDEVVSDVVVPDETTDDTVTDTTVDDADNNSDNSDSDGDDSDATDNLAPNGAPICPTLRDAESIDVVGVRPDWALVGTENFEFHTGIVDANDVDEEALMAVFAANNYATYEEFAELLTPFAIDLSAIHGIQDVTVTYTRGGTCTGDDWHGSAALASSRYEFEVVFPIVSNVVYEMPLYFDDEELQSYVPLKKNSDDPNFGRLVALNDKEMSIDEFLTIMDEMEASIDDFPTVGEAYGRHKVTFADYEDAWSVVTVVYPDKPGTGDNSGNGNGQVTPKPQNPTPAPQKPKLPAATSQTGTSQTGNSGNVTVVRASDMSYRQFRGNDANLTPIAPAPSQTTSVASEPTKTNDDVKNNQKTSEPKLPVTSGDKAGAALVTDDSSSASRSALLGLAACVAFGIVAAVSVIGVRRLMKANG